MPNVFKTYKTCLLAVKNDLSGGFALEFVPPNKIDLVMSTVAILKDGKMLAFVPDEVKTKALCQLAVLVSPEASALVPEKFF